MQITEGVGGVMLKGGQQSTQIEMISGLPSKMALKQKDKPNGLVIEEPFIFALND